MAELIEMHSFPIEEVRQQFPALQRQYKDRQAVYFDGPGGSQVVQSAIQAITSYMINGGANLHGAFPTSRETEQYIAEARQAVADFTCAKPSEVAFGANMTTLTLALSRALSTTWQEGDEIVVTELDHRANVDPWLRAAQDRGVTVRWLRVDRETLALDLRDLHEVITPKTRLVAVGLACNAVGTITDTHPIATRARDVGALVAVDAVHAAPHLALDRNALGADILLCSAYKFFGPHVGIAVVRDELFESLYPYKLKPAPDFIPDKLETGTQNHEGIAGIPAAIDFIASLGEGETRREKLVSAFAKIESYENLLADTMRQGLADIPGVKLFQAPADVPKTPTLAFQLEGFTPLEVCRYMAEEHSVFIAEGHFYASTLAEVLGIEEQGSWIRAGLAPYNTLEEVERFLNGLQQLLLQK